MLTLRSASHLGLPVPVSQPSPAVDRRPVLLCYDGSPGARRAIEQAAALLAERAALVVHVWASLEPQAFEHLPHDVGEVADLVIEELDRSGLRTAEEVAAEGVELARSAGFAARSVLARVPTRSTGHPETSVWQAIIRAADEHDAGVVVVVVGPHGLSGVDSVLLGSVSYGLAHNCRRPLLLLSQPSSGPR